MGEDKLKKKREKSELRKKSNPCNVCSMGGDGTTSKKATEPSA